MANISTAPSQGFFTLRGATLKDMKRVTVVMPPDLHKRLKLLSFEEDITMNDLVLAAVQEYIRKLTDKDSNRL